MCTTSRPGNLRHVPRWGLPALLIACWASPASTQVEAAAIVELSFLSGCWQGQMGALDMREQWTEPEAGVMLGTTRYFRDGALADFEFSLMTEEGGAVTLWPYPGGDRSEHGFRLVSAGEAFVFENMEHDFPVRIVYERAGRDRINPRIEGRDGTGPSWTLRRVSCPGS